MSAKVDTHSLSPGVRLGAYTIVRPLAVGGMAELYLAVPTRGDRYPVALKRMLPHLAWDPEFVRMFLDEVRIIAALDHPNIVRVLDYGIGDGSHFFAMEFVHGQTVASLQRHWKGPSPMPLPVGVAIVERVAMGLHYAHEPSGDRSGLVHRDLSPTNVMVAFDGTVKLLDFGIARLSQETQRTRAGTLKGKVGYMSPEQCKGSALDRRSDVFGLGVLLYELSVRRRAFFGDNDFAVMNRIVKGEFKRPKEVSSDVPDEVDALICDALSVEPDERPETAAAFAQRLGTWAQRAGLDRSRSMLSAFLHANYGTVPPPSLDVPEAQGDPTPVAVAVVPDPPGRRIWPVALAVGIGGVGFGLGGFFMGRPSEPSPGPAAPLATPAKAAPGPADPPSEVVVAEPTPPASADEPDEVIEIEPESDPEPVPTPQKRRGKKRRGKKRPGDRASPTAPRPGSTVLPPSWSGRDESG